MMGPSFVSGWSMHNKEWWPDEEIYKALWAYINGSFERAQTLGRIRNQAEISIIGCEFQYVEDIQ